MLKQIFGIQMYLMKLLQKKTIDVNLILIGDEWLSQQPEQIRKNLILEYEPIVFNNDKIGNHYNYNYNFFISI